MQDHASSNPTSLLPAPAPDDPQGMLHLCGVFKHVVFDRDGTLDRMMSTASDRA